MLLGRVVILRSSGARVLRPIDSLASRLNVRLSATYGLGLALIRVEGSGPARHRTSTSTWHFSFWFRQICRSQTARLPFVTIPCTFRTNVLLTPAPPSRLRHLLDTHTHCLSQTEYVQNIRSALSAHSRLTQTDRTSEIIPVLKPSMWGGAADLHRAIRLPEARGWSTPLRPPPSHHHPALKD